ncbi:MAG: DNA-deoxyinosine glycosylase [Clostridia bacterium]|nr:DNA-deoxyinosine glycosylase [Clostridia bacterium]
MPILHTISPVYDQNSRILILGSFPSVKSRESGFFYGHPQNRFWKVLSAVFEDSLPQTIDEKRIFLLKHRIALWDVIASCEIRGSSDQSIKNAVPNDLSIILETAQIQTIFTNGGTATRLYSRYLQEKTGREAISLPSTSPANAAFSLSRLIDVWRVICTQDA